MQPHKRLPAFSKDHFQRHPSKLSAPFHGEPSFSWVDQASGVGLARVTLQSQSFAGGGIWVFQWILPEGSTSTEALRGQFAAPERGEERVLVLPVEGLSPHVNQNVILQASPADRAGSTMAVVVSSHFEQTQEGEVIESLNAQDSVNSMQKMTPSPRGIPKGIQF
jgi:hypothetical protein